MHIYLFVVYIHVLFEFYLFFLYVNGLSCAPCGVGAHHSGDHYLRQWPPLMTDNHQVSLQLLTYDATSEGIVKEDMLEIPPNTELHPLLTTGAKRTQEVSLLLHP